MRKIGLFLISIIVSAQVLATTEKLTVILDWFPNPDHAPLIIAEQQGYFKEQGLDVTLVGPADPNDAPKLVAAKKADIGITYQPSFMEQVDRGLPLIRVGTLIDKPLNCLVVLNDSGIKSLADLKGKNIGSSNGGFTSTLLKSLLSKQNITEKDVFVTNVKYNLTQALLSHKVDAVTGMMRNYEVPQLESTGHKVTAFFPEEHGVPTYSELIFITHTANTNDKRLARFMAAIKKAVAYLDAHPQKAWELFTKQYPESNNSVNHDAWFATIPYFAEDPANFDDVDWSRFANFMQKNDLIKTVQPISRYAVIVKDGYVS